MLQSQRVLDQTGANEVRRIARLTIVYESDHADPVPRQETHIREKSGKPSVVLDDLKRG